MNREGNSLSEHAKIMAELLAMRTREEITAEQFEEAKRLASSAGFADGDLVAEKRDFFKEKRAIVDDNGQNPKQSSVLQRSVPREPSKAKDATIGMMILALIGFIVVKCISSAPDGQTQLKSRHILLTATQYGAAWPFPSFNDALLYCQIKNFGGVNRPLVLVQLGTASYGLNGAAMGIGGYPRATDFFPKDDYGYKEGVAQVVSELIVKAMRICE